MKVACVCLTLALHSIEDGGLLVATFSLNANITCKTYLKIKIFLHGTMKKIWVYRLRDLISYPESLYEQSRRTANFSDYKLSRCEL